MYLYIFYLNQFSQDFKKLFGEKSEVFITDWPSKILEYSSTINDQDVKDCLTTFDNNSDDNGNNLSSTFGQKNYFINIYLFFSRSHLEFLSYKTSLNQRCGAALDISTEELYTNSAKLRIFPGLYESIPRYYRGHDPQITLLTDQYNNN